MKLIRFRINRFGSWNELSLDLSKLGLCSITGQTGSGKSSIADAVSWLLFGETSKEGTSDDIRTWGEEEPTTGSIDVDTPQGLVEIHRVRGKATENDLYWFESDQGEPTRGKNIVETQKFLNTRLGVDSELYFTASYFHQFSKADIFFISKAQDRRDVFEKIVDQSLAISISDKVVGLRKNTKKNLDDLNMNLSKIKGHIESLTEFCQSTDNQFTKWEDENNKRILQAVANYDNFQNDKELKIQAQIRVISQISSMIGSIEPIKKEKSLLESKLVTIKNAEKEKNEINPIIKEFQTHIDIITKEINKLEDLRLNPICPTCLGPSETEARQLRVEELTKEKTVYLQSLSEIVQKYNEVQLVTSELHSITEQFEAIQNKLEEWDDLTLLVDNESNKLKSIKESINKFEQEVNELKSNFNPFIVQLSSSKSKLKAYEDEYVNIEQQIDQLKHKLSLLNNLYDVSFKFRGVLLSKVIKEIEKNTNKYLQKYFESEIKVRFNLEDSDKLDILIYKGENLCSFKQLSGGQRTLLKLAFNISIMKAAANKASVKFNCLFLDEILHGLDNSLKMKAFPMLQELSEEYDSVLVIDHCEELTNEFDSHLNVSMTGNTSQLIIS